MTDWNKLKVTELRAELKNRGLPTAGLKPVLIARLAAEEEDEAGSENTVEGDANTAVATSPDTISPVLADEEAKHPGGGHLNVAVTDSQHLAENIAITDFQDSANVVMADSNIEILDNTPRDSIMAEPQIDPPSTQATTIESPLPLSRQDPHGSGFSSVEPQEALEDRQKRKRRSQSPPPTSDPLRKRFRPSDVDMKDGVVTSQEADVGVEPGPTFVDASEEEVKGQGEGAKQSTGDGMDVDVQQQDDVGVKTEGVSAEPNEDSPSRTRDSRFKKLFGGETQGVAMTKSLSRESGVEEVEEPDRIIAPATHPATSALYIRDIMRPLNPTQFKSYLATLAAPPGQDPNPQDIVSFYLNPIRTHAFISLTNTSSASRIRSALHDRVWPEEKNRKPLWVDFVPVEKIEEWIEMEQSNNTGSRSMSKKWEICYDVDDDRHVTAVLQEVGNIPRPVVQRKPSVPVPQPEASQPRGLENAPSAPRAFHNHPPAVNNTKKLDELFKFTTTEPKLYWMPVAKELANRRLDAIDDALSRDATAGRRVGGEINRYTFEDGDKFVDRGPEIFPGIRPPPGHRGPRGGGPRGGGGFSRGGYGGGGEGRSYDSYRGNRGGRSDFQGSRRESRDYGGRY
jgi:hypothetical protein